MQVHSSRIVYRNCIDNKIYFVDIFVDIFLLCIAFLYFSFWMIFIDPYCLHLENIWHLKINVMESFAILGV